MLLEPGYGKTMVFTEFYSVHYSIVISFPQENSGTCKLSRAHSDSYYWWSSQSIKASFSPDFSGSSQHLICKVICGFIDFPSADTNGTVTISNDQ